MFEYIKGEIVELSPTEAIVECGNIGYIMLISLQTYSYLQNVRGESKIYIHHHIREDEEAFYGFATKDERSLFRLLIGVSGIGAGTARMMLSSLTTEEIQTAIISSDVNKIKSIKGIGLKTAQRLILELKDKVTKVSADIAELIDDTPATSSNEEAATALVMLGFARPNVMKVLKALNKEYPGASLEELIKYALKRL